MIGLYEDGKFDTAFKWNDATSPIPRTLMPSYVAEIVRRELIGRPDAGDEFDNRFLWIE